MKGLRYQLALVAANFLLPISLIIFSTGFFPHKPFLPGLAQYQSIDNAVPPEAPFNKVVFMVVDALRSDFVYSERSGFEFTQSLIRDGYAIPFTSRAQAPTVTMPRVKALTTGSIPSFLDMILNIAESDTTSTLAHQDTWIGQMKHKGSGKLTMFGDDTWLKLFPDTFDRADGTTSFYVSDYTEVDNNVTRHVPEQLGKSDWSVMIMHYLGMDHIGHKSGSSSVNMVPKQREMDDVVEDIYQAFATKHHLNDTLLILCGDHGMTDGGNHGGSAPGETSPAMMFISPKFSALSQGTECPTEPHRNLDYYDVIEQSDIAPTLGGLLGFPVPLNNLGVFIPKLLPLFNDEDDQIQLLYRNALQLVEIVKVSFPHAIYTAPEASCNCEGSLTVRDELACSWKEATSSLNKRPWSTSQNQERLLKFCYKAQTALSSISSNYNAARLYLGISLAILAVLLAAPSLWSTIGVRRRHYLSRDTVYLVSSAVLYVIMMFASSYVEEEQQFWYWMSSTWTFLPGRTRLRPFGLTVLLFLRLLRRWNQSGQKFAGSPDIALFLRSHSSILRISCITAYWAIFTDLALTLEQHRQACKRQSRLARCSPWLLSLSIITPAIIFKLGSSFNDSPELFDGYERTMLSMGTNPFLSDLVSLARAVWVACGIALAQLWFVPNSRGVEKRLVLLAILQVLLATQVRLTNLPTLFLFRGIWAFLVASIRATNSERSLWTLLLAHVSFFAMGGTNGISSIDLSNAYNGISGYDPLPVGILLFISNWAGPIYFSVAGTISTWGDSGRQRPKQAKNRQIRSKWEAWSEHIGKLTWFMGMAVLGVEAACCALREHLFVWTVFSPKFLYVCAWVGGWHLGVNVLVGALLVWLVC